MSFKEKLIKEKLPAHIAIIMDGNGRWAKKQNKMRIFGHKEGVRTVRKITEASVEIGIKYLTLYTFSTENWNRPKLEVEGLMSLLVSTVNEETKTLMDNNVQLLTIGNIDAMPKKVADKLRSSIEQTSKNDGMKLILALSYSSRWEITEAVRRIACDTANGKLQSNDITADLISSYLQTAQIPDPELLIRTSGERRISNFLLWQIAYSELYFTDLLWPEFTEESLYEALYDYQCRERRFGKTSEQLIHQQ